MAGYVARNRHDPKCKFSIDFTIFMMNRFYPGYEWEPNPDIAYPLPGSPFTPAVRNAVKQIFLDHRLEMHSCFEELLEIQGDQNVLFQNMCDFIMHDSCITINPFHCRNFLNVCVALCSYGARSYYKGCNCAIEIVMSFIVQIVERLTKHGLFTEDAWQELDAFCAAEFPKPAF